MTNSNHDNPLKPWINISLFSTTIKITDLFIAFMKGFFAICVIASLSLLTYSSLSGDGPSKWQTVSEQKQFPIFDPTIIVDYEKDAVFPTKTYNEDKTNLSHIVFGISGTASSWENRRSYVESWWKPNVTRGFVWLDQEPDTWPYATSPPYKVSEDTSRFKYTCWYGSRAAIRIARIVKETFELGLENVRWFVMGDDDTVFFTENLVMVLGKYDHRQMYYIGGNSESVEQDVIHSYGMGYGGGGFAISYPLAKELVRVLDGCIDRYSSFYGSDQKIGGCMNEIGVPLTKELGFHQVDLRGEPYGYLAAHPVAPLLSLHHLDYIKPIFPGLTQINSINKLVGAHKLDPGRTLQQTFCYDISRNWSISISWGYTIQIYPTIVNAKDLGTPFRTFVTWRSWSEGPFTFNTRSLSTDPCQRPVVYFLDRVKEVGKGRTVSTYKRFKGDPEKNCEYSKYDPVLSVDLVQVSAATLELDTWKKARRRHCCEIVNDHEDGVVSVHIRSCKGFESVTPP